MKKAFAVWELLIVLAILGFLAITIIPQFTNTYKQPAGTRTSETLPTETSNMPGRYKGSKTFDLKDIHAGDFIRWKDGTVSLVFQVSSNQKLLWLRDSFDQHPMPAVRFQDVETKVSSVCQRKTDYDGWKSYCDYCAIYVQNISDMQAPSTQPAETNP